MSMERRTKLFRIRKTLSKMLNARGYLVSQKELDRDKDSFTEDFGDDPRRENLTIMVPKRDDPSENVSALNDSTASTRPHLSIPITASYPR